jgi:hypothetical protein
VIAALIGLKLIKQGYRTLRRRYLTMPQALPINPRRSRVHGWLIRSGWRSWKGKARGVGGKAGPAEASLKQLWYVI